VAIKDGLGLAFITGRGAGVEEFGKEGGDAVG